MLAAYFLSFESEDVRIPVTAPEKIIPNDFRGDEAVGYPVSPKSKREISMR